MHSTIQHAFSTRKRTLFNDACIAKKYTRTKLPTIIELYYQYLEFNSNLKQIIQDLRLNILIWEESDIPNVPFTNIQIKCTRLLTNIKALSKFNHKQNFEMKKKEFFEKHNKLFDIASFSCYRKSKDPYAIDILCSCRMDKKIQNKELAFYLDQMSNIIQRIESHRSQRESANISDDTNTDGLLNL